MLYCSSKCITILYRWKFLNVKDFRNQLHIYFSKIKFLKTSDYAVTESIRDFENFIFESCLFLKITSIEMQYCFSVHILTAVLQPYLCVFSIK